MDLDTLRAFLAVVDTGSFLAASTMLRWSRATLRRRVDELEVFVGVPLLVRTEQGATPTASGEVLARRGRELLAQSSAMLALVREASALPETPLRVLIPVGLPPKVIALVSAAQRAATPEVRMHLRVVEDPVALLHEDVDLAFSFNSALPEGPWVSREIVRIPERLSGTPAYLAEKGTPATLDDLEQHALLVWKAPGTLGAALPLQAGGERPVVPTLCSPDLHILRECAAAGLGLYYGPGPSLAGDLGAGGDLVPVLDQLVGRERALHLILPETQSHQPRLASAIEHLLTILGASGG